MIINAECYGSMRSDEFINEMRASGLGVFTSVDAVKVLGSSKAYANLFLHRLASRNKIRHIGRRLYAVEGVGRLEIANSLAPNGYVSGLAALFYYGFINQDPLIIDIVNTKKSLSRSIAYGRSKINVRIIKISKKGFFGYKKEMGNIGYFLIAEPEKALLDALYIYKDKLASYCKDALEGGKSGISKEKLIEYAERTGSSALLKMLGKIGVGSNA